LIGFAAHVRYKFYRAEVIGVIKVNDFNFIAS
jgi:hypothetical protein